MGKKIVSKYCACCGKEISEYFILDDYAYKLDGKVFCSYHCLRQYEKANGFDDVKNKIVSDVKQHEKNLKILDDRLKVLSYKNLF